MSRPNGSPTGIPTTASAEIRVANRLRELRADKGLTMSGLAALAGISQAYLSRVENHKAALPIASLERLAAALAIPIQAFFEVDSRTIPITLCRIGRGLRGRIRGPKGYSCELLVPEKRGKLMEPFLEDVASALRPMVPRSHAGDEFNYVLSGECTLVYGKQEIRLSRGDAAYYDATTPHAARAIGKKPCTLLVVVSSREYLFHGDIRHFLQGTAP